VFGSFLEWGGVGDSKLSRFHTRCTVRVRGEDCSNCCLLYPCCVAWWAEPSGFQPIRVQDAGSVVCYVGGTFLEARPRVSCIMRNGALWECLLRVSGWSYKVSSPWQRNERLRSVIFDGKCYFRRLSQLAVY